MKRVYNYIKTHIVKFLYTFGYANTIKGLSICYRISSLEIYGTGNFIEVHSSLPKDVKITVYGNDHHLYVDKGVTFKKGCLWFEDKKCEIRISTGTTIGEAHLAVAENGTKLILGEDCMLSSNIRMATTDSHSIIDSTTGKRTNPAADIIIEPHVWIGYGASVNKGVTIGHNSVIAGHSVVTNSVFPNNCVIAGIPAKVVKENIDWNRFRI